jgi:hypothetical protein
VRDSDACRFGSQQVAAETAAQIDGKVDLAL